MRCRNGGCGTAGRGKKRGGRKPTSYGCSYPRRLSWYLQMRAKGRTALFVVSYFCLSLSFKLISIVIPWCASHHLGTGLGGGQNRCLQRAATAWISDEKTGQNVRRHSLDMLFAGMIKPKKKARGKGRKTAFRASPQRLGQPSPPDVSSPVSLLRSAIILTNLLAVECGSKKYSSQSASPTKCRQVAWQTYSCLGLARIVASLNAVRIRGTCALTEYPAMICCFWFYFYFVYPYSHITYINNDNVHFTHFSRSQSARWRLVASSPVALRPGLSQEDKTARRKSQRKTDKGKRYTSPTPPLQMK